MNEEASRYTDAISDLDNSTCACSECDTAFCASRRYHRSRPCKDCEQCEPPVFCFDKITSHNTAIMTDYSTKPLSIRSIVSNVRLSEESVEISNKSLSKESLKIDSGVNENGHHPPKSEDFKPFKVSDPRKKTSTTTAQLSAQIMNVSYTEFQESVSYVRPENVVYNTKEIFKRIKEAYDACSCKICECITGNSILPSNSDSCGLTPCSCEPCNCKDCEQLMLNIGIDPCVRYLKRPNTSLNRIKEFKKINDGCDKYRDCNKHLLNVGIGSRMGNLKSPKPQRINDELTESTDCDCKPCDCIRCQKISSSQPCNCKPCECYECKSMRALGKKTVIVAPVGEGNQRANCLCSPCACARCSHPGLNLSPNRGHEMSTGIDRHPNCRCEACVDDTCEPNGTGSCRCEGRHGVISKPVENNPHDYDIRSAAVSSKPMKTTLSNKFYNSTFVAMNIDKFPPGSSKGFDEHGCKCGVCECIVCKCKGNDFHISKSSQNLDDSLKTLKLPSRELKNCQCSPCECQYCSMKKQAHFSESTEYKSCICEKCDCVHCEGELKPRYTLSKLIPVSDTNSREMCRCKPCECKDCEKMAASRNVVRDTCHCDVCRCKQCADESNTSHEALYPIKKSETLTPSMIGKDLLSEPELLTQSSEYTHLKHSMAKSNVFNRSRASEERSQQNFTIYHMTPNTNLKSLHSGVPLKSVVNQTEFNSDTKSKNKKIEMLDQNKEELKHWRKFNSPSTSKTLSENEPSTVANGSHGSNKTVAISNVFRSTSLSSTSESTHNLVYLTPSRLSIISSHKKEEISLGSLRKPKEINKLGTTVTILTSAETSNSKQVKCHHCGSRYGESEIYKNTSNGITQTAFCNISNYNNDSLFKDPIFNCLRLDHSDGGTDDLLKRLKYYDKDEKDYVNKNNYHAWKFQRPNSRSYNLKAVDKSLYNKSASYEKAMTTLKKAKEFSHELVTLLQKIDKANLEFESISQNLKRTHESMLNNIENDFYDQSSIKQNSQNNHEYVNPDNKLSQAMLNNNKKSKINVYISSLGEEHIKDNVTLPYISKELNDSKRFEEAKIMDRNKPVTAILGDTIHVKRAKMLEVENKASKELINSFYTANEGPREGLATELSPTVNSKMELDEQPDSMKYSPNGYKGYKKMVKRSANIARKQKEKNIITTDMGCVTMPVTVPKKLEKDLLKSIVGQEVNTILKQFGEIKRTPIPSPREKPIAIQRTLENEVKELLNMTLLQTASADGLTESKLKEARRKTIPSTNFLINQLKHPKSDSSVPICNKYFACDGMKPVIIGLRRVSDHTVTVKWEAPKDFKEIKGFEVLVNGDPVEKLFGPSDRMAVVTCLPRSECVQLAVRTVVGRRSPCGHDPCRTVTYHPRDR